MSVLGIIAGGGDLPRAVAEVVRESGRAVFVMPLTGSVTENWFAAFPHQWASPGAPGAAFKALKQAGVSDIVLVGKVDRPRFSELKVDAKGVLLLPKAIAAARKGDDALLRFIVGMFEDDGFRALSVSEAAPGLLCDAGNLGKLGPDADAKDDIAHAFRIVRTLGALDVGQAAVVCDGLALSVEAADGTDAMIARVGDLREALRGTPARRRGVLVKALKPTQDARTDMPVIGVQTVERAASVGLAGIALEAGGALIVDKKAVAARADALGLFITGIAP